MWECMLCCCDTVTGGDRVNACTHTDAGVDEMTEMVIDVGVGVYVVLL